jgi:N-acetylneuraminic acid mutarotase
MTAEVFDPASNSFTYTAGPMSSQRIGHTATLLVSGKVLLAGGYISSITRPSVGTADLYDPQTNSFSATGSMAFGRDSHTATRLPDGKVLVAGGYSGSQLSGYTVRSDIEVYDPVAGTFSLLAASMGTPRYGHTATVLVLGGARILFAGGHTSTGSNAATSGAEVYDMAAPLPTILPTASMASARADHTATMLPNGKVLFAGGHDGATVLSSAEIYDPVTNVFTSAGSLSAGRYGQGAALLGYGSVLLSGGTLQSGSATASAELYRPGQ